MAKATAATPLMRRVEFALKERRIAQAIDLAKQHVREQPGPNAEAFLRKTLLAAAEYQASRNAFREVHQILVDAEKLSCDDPAWWKRLAELRADVGDHAGALKNADRAGDPSLRPKILARVIDRAMSEGPAGKDMVPQDLRPQFDAARKAFAEYETGRDEPARETLNAIPLSSPFLDWKLLIRGLIAWSANDLPRAIENWARLSPERMPARLAAPLRYGVDKTYAQSLPADRGSVVARQAEQVSAGGVVDGLRRIRKSLATEGWLQTAFMEMLAILPEVKRLYPHLVPRLANVFYWAIVSGGQPQDMQSYSRMFGTPSDDPSFFRLQALVGESIRKKDLAHSMWGKYLAWIEQTPNRWPGAQADRARALLWERMGRLAEEWLEGDEDDEDDFFSMFSRNVRRPSGARKSLSPSAEECFASAARLAPDWPKPALELFRVAQRTKPELALQTLADLLQRFPGNLEVLTKAMDYYEAIGDRVKSRECIRLALVANPLDRDLRTKVARIAIEEARRHALAKDHVAAKESLKEAASLGIESLAPAIHALAAAVCLITQEKELADRHLEALRQRPNSRLSAAYRLLIEFTRLKLKKKELDLLRAAYEQAMAPRATAAELSELLDAAGHYFHEPDKYRGLQTHMKQFVERVLHPAGTLYSEDELVMLGLALHRNRLWKPLKDFSNEYFWKFKENPNFAFFMAEAHLEQSKSHRITGRIRWCYVQVQKALKQGHDGRYAAIQTLFDERCRKTPEIEEYLRGFQFFHEDQFQ